KVLRIENTLMTCLSPTRAVCNQVNAPGAPARRLSARAKRCRGVAGTVADTPRLVSSCASYFFSTRDRKSTRLNSSHVAISYAVFCLKKKKIAKLVNLKLNVDPLTDGIRDS